MAWMHLPPGDFSCAVHQNIQIKKSVYHFRIYQSALKRFCGTFCLLLKTVQIINRKREDILLTIDKKKAFYSL